MSVPSGAAALMHMKHKKRHTRCVLLQREIFVVCLFSVRADRQTFMSIKEMFLTSCLKPFREVCVCTTSSFEQITHLTFPVPVPGVECLCSISSIRSSWHHLTSFFNWDAEFRLSLNASHSSKDYLRAQRVD